MKSNKLRHIIRESINQVLRENGSDRRMADAYFDAVNSIQKKEKWSAWIERHRDLDPLDAENAYCDAERYVERLNNYLANDKGDIQARNRNIQDLRGRYAMDALGARGRFRGMQAIKNGNRDMSIEDALKEFDKIARK